MKIRVILFLFLSTTISLEVFAQALAGKRIVRQRVVATQPAETLQQKIVRISRAYQIDPRLFHSLIYTESAGKADARSNKGAGCLTQLMPATARRFGLRVDNQIDERFSDTEKCLQAGARYLRLLITMFDGDVRLALAGYNAGEGAVVKYGNRIPPFRETVKYVEKICALYYGQSGHGVAAAYNQRTAALWAAEVYRTRKLSPVAMIPDYQSSSQHAVSLTDKPSAKPPPTVSPNKPSVTRVSVETTNIRLRTASLSFY